jgi:hypothetical protein
MAGDELRRLKTLREGLPEHKKTDLLSSRIDVICVEEKSHF